MNSPVVKLFGDERIAAGERLLVVDLGACTGMDSTFMGTLAGMATRLAAADERELHIADPGERNRRSLEELGLDFLMRIDPPTTVWRDDVAFIRSELKPPQTIGTPGQTQRARHVLEAHQNLSGINNKNAGVFSEVVNMLEAELAEKDKLEETSGWDHKNPDTPPKC